MGQPPVYILRAPTPGMPQYPQQTIEPRTREKKIIQIKDPNQSNKQVTQEILKQKPVGSLTSTVAGTPNVTPNLSAQSSNSSTSPLTSQQQAEENLRAQFATNLANKKITNVRVEIFTAQEVPKRESTKISAPVVSEIKTEEKVEPDESEKPVATDALPVSESKTLNGPTTTVSHEQAGEETEKVTTINSEVEVETAPAPDAAVAVAPEPSKAPEDDVTTQNEETTQGSEEPEVLPPSSQVEEASGMEKVNGHDGERKASPASKSDSQVTGLYLTIYLSCNLAVIARFILQLWLSFMALNLFVKLLFHISDWFL